jgi:glycine/D-amino acid oxidase-like deaminating enzyme
MSSKASDVLIVGGGIVGAACAWAFAREKMSVTLIESKTIGGGATAAGMGHLVVMGDSEAQFALTRYSQDLWQEIVDELPADCEYEPCGTLWVAADDEEMDAVRRKHDFYGKRGVPTEILDSAALLEAEPNLRRELVGGLLVPRDCVVYPPCVARWLIERVQDHGAQVRVGSRAVEISDDGVRLSDGSRLSAGLAVSATGTWATDLTPGLDVKPRKGHLVITDRYPDFVNHQLIELGYLKSAHAVAADSVAFNVQPRLTGQLLIGSSRQFGDETDGVDSAILSGMVSRALEYMPRLAQLSAIRTWTGFRAATSDKLPLIGPCPGFAKVHLATGHEGLGITTSLGTARLLVDQVTGRGSAIPRGPYLPSRLAAGETSE